MSADRVSYYVRRAKVAGRVQYVLDSQDTRTTGILALALLAESETVLLSRPGVTPLPARPEYGFRGARIP
jgi:hypothetical protein